MMLSEISTFLAALSKIITEAFRHRSFHPAIVLALPDSCPNIES